MAKHERPTVEVKSRKAWRAWLAAHHAASAGVWVVTYKRDSGGPHVPYDDIVREALCFGWTDSLPRKLDAERSMLLVTPRKPKSAWSAANKKRVADALVVPDDLGAALAARASARANFDGFPPSVRRGILEWISNAKKPETRKARVDETASRAGKNQRANQWRPPGT